MITVVQEFNMEEHAEKVRGMFALRAKVFGARLGWDVSVRNGLERDTLDDESPVYLIYTDMKGRVTGSCRLLPTTGTTLISTVFRDTLPDAAYLNAPSIWECTRFCVDEDHARSASSDSLFKICGELLTQIGVLSLASGIETIIGNFDETMLRLYRRVGCPVEILGYTDRFGDRVYLGAFSVVREVVEDGLERFPMLAIPRSKAAAPVHIHR